ncbi:MAG TPA: DNA gyrase C-terminal beta-propeller domain-containing protein, partial [Sphingomicrobium sp.]|nr:DNA gyrase C-terminal beta-propeller domain-containing protein [Sphingomicrobium sp.]
TIDLEADSEIVAMFVVRPDMDMLAASSDGRGFLAKGEAVLAETRKGKQLMNLRPKAKMSVLKEVKPGADHIAVIGDNRKMLVFKRDELPELGRGSGVQLQRYRDGGLSDAMAFVLADGISWPLGGDSGRVRSETDLTPWRAIRGASGRIAPNGFPRSNRFEPVLPSA